jgi:hypothetical protein
MANRQVGLWHRLLYVMIAAMVCYFKAVGAGGGMVGGVLRRLGLLDSVCILRDGA